MADETYYNPNTRRYETRHTTSDESVAAAGAAVKRSETAAEAGKREKKGKSPMPKQNPGESASDYGERLRRWRSGEGAEAQAKGVEQK